MYYSVLFFFPLYPVVCVILRRPDFAPPYHRIGTFCSCASFRCYTSVFIYSQFMYIFTVPVSLDSHSLCIFNVLVKSPGDIVQFPFRCCKYFLIFVHFVYCVFMRKALIFMHNKTQHCFGNLDLFGGFHHAEERN